jgi:hypothetical protein
MRTLEEALDTFRYHAPTEETIPKYNGVNASFQSLVENLWPLMPDGPGKTYALRKLQDARMAVNACIANNGQ